MKCPRIEINCDKIAFNARELTSRLKQKGLSMTPVTKVCLAHPDIVSAFIEAGVKMLADSRIENIEKMRHAGFVIPTLLIRSPMLSQATRVAQYCDISVNTEIVVIKALSQAAQTIGKTHGIVLMIELGDLREGILMSDVMDFIQQIISLPNITLRGIGTNLACRYGVEPNEKNMQQLSDLAVAIEQTFDIQLDIISGGNSANLQWALNTTHKTKINNLRIGEAIFLGFESLHKLAIDGLYTDAFLLVAEVIESKEKPSLPWGTLGFNAFGERPVTCDKGIISQSILAMGRQDVAAQGLTPPKGITIIAANSDHLIVETHDIAPLKVGQEIGFQVDYSALLSSMSSPFIYKHITSATTINKVSNI